MNSMTNLMSLASAAQPALDSCQRAEKEQSGTVPEWNPTPADNAVHHQHEIQFQEIQAMIDNLSCAVARYGQSPCSLAPGETVDSTHRAALDWVLTTLEDVSATCQGIALHCAPGHPWHDGPTMAQATADGE